MNQFHIAYVESPVSILPLSFFISTRTFDRSSLLIFISFRTYFAYKRFFSLYRFPSISNCIVLPFPSFIFRASGPFLSWLFKFLEKLGIRVTFIKSTPYHLPRMNNYLYCSYYGDGFGCLSESGDLPWHPSNKHFSFDTCSSSGFNINAPIVFGYPFPNKRSLHYDDSSLQCILKDRDIAFKYIKYCSDKAQNINIPAFNVDSFELIDHVFVLPNLSPHRCSYESQLLLFIELITSFTSLGQSCLIFFHPQQINSSCSLRKRSIPTDIYNNLPSESKPLYYNSCLKNFIHPLNYLPIELTALRLQKSNQIPTFHVYSSSVFTLLHILPNDMLSFGLGSRTICRYFYPDAARLHLSFERSIVTLISSFK